MYHNYLLYKHALKYCSYIWDFDWRIYVDFFVFSSTCNFFICWYLHFTFVICSSKEFIGILFESNIKRWNELFLRILCLCCFARNNSIFLYSDTLEIALLSFYCRILIWSRYSLFFYVPMLTSLLCYAGQILSCLYLRVFRWNFCVE